MAFRIRTQPSAVLVLGLPALYGVAHILKKMFDHMTMQSAFRKYWLQSSSVVQLTATNAMTRWLIAIMARVVVLS